MTYANLSRDGIAVLMPDRHRLVVTVTAHYKNFPLLTFYGTALQILQTAASQQAVREATVVAGATVAPRAANGAPGTNPTNHADHNTKQRTLLPCHALCRMEFIQHLPVSRRRSGAALARQLIERRRWLKTSEQTEPKLALF
jgi:hypothetical protein